MSVDMTSMQDNSCSSQASKRPLPTTSAGLEEKSPTLGQELYQ